MLQLNYDKPQNPATDKAPIHTNLSVGDQVKRSVDFANTLGFADYFSYTQLPYTIGRENKRNYELKKHFLDRSIQEEEGFYYLNQMATTTFIAAHFLEYGQNETTEILYQGFNQRDERYFPFAIQQTIDEYINDARQQISLKSEFQAKPLILLHIRDSSHANDNLNLPEPFVKGLANFLSKNYQVCLILASDLQKKQNIWKIRFPCNS